MVVPPPICLRWMCFGPPAFSTRCFHQSCCLPSSSDFPGLVLLHSALPKGWGLLQGSPAPPSPWHPAQNLVPSSCSRNVKQGPGPAPCSSRIALPARMAKKIQSQLAGARARLSLSWGGGPRSL